VKSTIENALLDVLQPIIDSSVRQALKQNSKLLSNNKPDDEWLDVNGAAKHLKISKNTLYSLTSKRKIPFYKRGKPIFFLKSELDAWLKAGRIDTTEEIDYLAEKYDSVYSKN
jgi:excisionase family DNA binding protein